eukprot:m.750232 g.750232  ORF g.750232 m.750232 type:complete len:257 (-) comp58979_c0_seq8:2216-2986(-)
MARHNHPTRQRSVSAGSQDLVFHSAGRSPSCPSSGSPQPAMLLLTGAEPLVPATEAAKASSGHHASGFLGNSHLLPAPHQTSVTSLTEAHRQQQQPSPTRRAAPRTASCAYFGSASDELHGGPSPSLHGLARRIPSTPSDLSFLAPDRSTPAALLGHSRAATPCVEAQTDPSLHLSITWSCACEDLATCPHQGIAAARITARVQPAPPTHILRLMPSSRNRISFRRIPLCPPLPPPPPKQLAHPSPFFFDFHATVV